MNNVKSIIKNLLVFVILIAVTFLIIFKSYDFKETINIVLTANYKYVILAVLCMISYFVFEGINNKMILSSLGKKIKLISSVKYSIIGFFFSGITPAATGGQPMQIYYMNKDGISVENATLSLMVQLASFQIITIGLGIVGAIVNTELFTDGFIWLFLIGTFIKMIGLSIMIIGLFYSKFSKKLVNIIIKILEKFKYDKLEEKKKQFNNMIDNYNKDAKYIKENKEIIFKSLCIVFLQFIVYYTISYFIYRSFGLNSFSWIKLIMMQALLFVSVSSLPLPGSVGVSEGGFLRIYSIIYGSAVLGSAMILNRVINFYLFMLVAAIVIIITNIINSNRKKTRIDTKN